LAIVSQLPTNVAAIVSRAIDMDRRAPNLKASTLPERKGGARRAGA
jgi:hypothetical protein